MFWRDHNPPHFHARYANFRALVSIADLQVIAGQLPRATERVVLEWARAHQAELMENWRLCEQAAQPNPIPPPP